MSRKRKNSGEGYGYMFHGSFNSKSDAAKKERTRKGAFVKRTSINGQTRYTVMSPRTNPIKRKKKDKAPNFTAADRKRASKLLKASLAPNPSELIVMGANPSPTAHTINLPPNSTITIRTNPEPAIRDNWMGAERTRILGDLHQQQEKEFKEQMNSRKRVRFAESRPKFPFTRKKKSARANPSAAALREKFTGTEVNKVSVYREPHMPAGDYAQLGTLLALYVKPISGGQVQSISFPQSSGRPLVVADESARQIYFVGGDQAIDPRAIPGARAEANIWELGECRRIDYKQRKEHVPDPELDEWRHEFGEESGVRPTLLYDAVNRRLMLDGGEYVIRTEGIIN